MKTKHPVSVIALVTENAWKKIFCRIKIHYSWNIKKKLSRRQIVNVFSVFRK